MSCHIQYLPRHISMSCHVVICHVLWFGMRRSPLCTETSGNQPRATELKNLWPRTSDEDMFAFSEQPELVSFPCGRFPRLSPQHPQRGAIAVKRRQVQQGTA